MFSQKLCIIFLKKDRLIVSLVKLGNPPKIIKTDSTGWTQDSLAATFNQIKAQLGTSEARLLLSDDLSSVFKPIAAAAASAGLSFSAVEPESIAKLRHPDPVIGLALKSEASLPAPAPKSNRFHVNKTSLLIVLSISLVMAIIAGGIVTSQNALTSKLSSSPVLLVSALPLPESSPSPSPEPGLVLTGYKLLVLNGTGGKDVAAAAKAMLLGSGFANVKADNAETQNFTQTEIQLKPAAPEKLYEIIFQTLSPAYEVTRSAELLPPDSNYDVVITVGTKKEQ